jgi:hypothetical protein
MGIVMAQLGIYNPLTFRVYGCKRKSECEGKFFTSFESRLRSVRKPQTTFAVVVLLASTGSSRFSEYD